MVPLTQVREVQAGSQSRCCSPQGPLAPHSCLNTFPGGLPFMFLPSAIRDDNRASLIVMFSEQ